MDEQPDWGPAWFSSPSQGASQWLEDATQAHLRVCIRWRRLVVQQRRQVVYYLWRRLVTGAVVREDGKVAAWMASCWAAKRHARRIMRWAAAVLDGTASSRDAAVACAGVLLLVTVTYLLGLAPGMLDSGQRFEFWTSLCMHYSKQKTWLRNW